MLLRLMLILLRLRLHLLWPWMKSNGIFNIFTSDKGAPPEMNGAILTLGQVPLEDDGEWLKYLHQDRVIQRISGKPGPLNRALLAYVFVSAGFCTILKAILRASLKLHLLSSCDAKQISATFSRWLSKILSSWPIARRSASSVSQAISEANCSHRQHRTIITWLMNEYAAARWIFRLQSPL